MCVCVHACTREGISRAQAPQAQLLHVPVPSEEELEMKVRELVKGADLSTMTFSDLYNQLTAIYNVDLSYMKNSLRRFTQNALQELGFGPL